MSSHPDGADRAALRPILKPLHVGALALGCIIGFGCFVLPGDFLATAGPFGATLGVVLGGLAVLVIARSYGLMVRVLPVAGAEFAYAYQACGRHHAYVCGWFLALGYVSIVPLNATALGVLAKFVAPDLFARGYLYSVGGYDVFVGEVTLATAAIVAVGLLHHRGVRGVGALQVGLTALLVGSVLLIGVATPLTPAFSVGSWQPGFAPGRSVVGAVLAIVAISPWLYVGFDTLPQAAEEFDFEPRQGRRLMTVAILAGAVMYVVMILATASILPWETLVGDGPLWATGTTVQRSLGTPGLTVLTVAVVTAVSTGINGFYMASSRLLFSMGRAKLLPPWFARVDPAHGTPVNAIVFTGVVSLAAPWFGREAIVWVVDMSAVGTAFGYAYTSVAAYAVARAAGRDGRVDAGFAIGGALLSASFVLLLCLPGAPAFMATPSWIAMGVWVALGAAFYLSRVRSYAAIPAAELDTLVLGDRGRYTA